MAAEISAQVNLQTPEPPPKRETAQQKARRIREESKGDSTEKPKPQTRSADPEETNVIPFPRLTARVEFNQLKWLRARVKEYRKKSLGPKLTNDELTRISLSLLQDAVEKEGDIVTFVNKYRAGEMVH